MKQTTIDTRFFRAGVGTVIYNQSGEVALFERAKYPVGVWQFQQGGIDTGEHVEATLWRELDEEIGMNKDDIQSVHEMPNWTVYQNPGSVLNSQESRLGQAHKWFFLEIKPGHSIDLSLAKDDETANFKWVKFPEAVTVTDSLKKHVYQELETYFFKHIKPNN